MTSLLERLRHPKTPEIYSDDVCAMRDAADAIAMLITTRASLMMDLESALVELEKFRAQQRHKAS